MCGIFACIHCLHRPFDSTLKVQLLEKLKRRGPDCTGEAAVPIGDHSVQLEMVGTLLHMRGAEPTPQPLMGNGNLLASAGDTEKTSTGDNLLLWNGNIFGGEIEVAAEENDTQKLFGLLNQQLDDSGILSTLGKIHGPWAFVYWQSSTSSLWFGRDVFGRRSLLWHLPLDPLTDCFSLSSIGQYHPDKMPLGYWFEVPAAGIFQLRCSGDNSIGGDLFCYPWMQGDSSFQTDSTIDEELASLTTSCLKIHRVDNLHLQVPFPPLNKSLPQQQQQQDVQHLESSPKSASSSETATHQIERTKPSEIESSASSGNAVEEEETIDSSSSISKGVVVRDDPSLSLLLSPASTHSIDWSALSKQLIAVLEKAIRARVVRAPYLPSSTQEASATTSSSSTSLVRGCRKSESESESQVLGMESRHSQNEEHQPVCREELVASKGDSDVIIRGRARIAILFSGGVDSMLLAALTDRCLDPDEEIDFINVAFEQRSSQDSGAEINFDVPDRISSIENLKELNPNRKWNLVLVNVSRDEVDTIRKERVSHLIFPLCTVLDDSIGCAFWFAARGQGSLYHYHGDVKSHHYVPAEPLSQTIYQSQARTLFVGVGADEQLAGYSRHRTKFRSSGWAGLLAEVEMDVKRLARRNLGRDDRCIADHHREGQFPFLDEEVVTYLQQLPVHCKADLGLPRGVGEKRLLREAAAMLGCHGASKLPKRAIQFGSRMAKLAGSSNSRELGSDICKRLLPQT